MLLKYCTGVIPSTSQLLIAAHILDSSRMFWYYIKWGMAMDINPEDEMS
jgi:hypothetical protein